MVFLIHKLKTYVLLNLLFQNQFMIDAFSDKSNSIWEKWINRWSFYSAEKSEN